MSSSSAAEQAIDYIISVARRAQGCYAAAGGMPMAMFRCFEDSGAMTLPSARSTDALCSCRAAWYVRIVLNDDLCNMMMKGNLHSFQKTRSKRALRQ